MSLRPSAPVWLDAAAGVSVQAIWATHLRAASSAAPTAAHVIIGGVSVCHCDDDALGQLRDWAVRSGLDIVELADAPPGVAVIDQRGRLRYAGDAGALVTSCAGLSGFKQWWAVVDGESPRAQFTAACGCGA